MSTDPFDLDMLSLGHARGRVDVRVLAECDSTNARLLEMARGGAAAGTVVCAERQTAGRGRRGRTWHQGEHGLVFSLLWRLPAGTSADGLSLAAGIAVAECLGDGAHLKWPNDVLLDGGKVAGVLVESNALGLYVIGIGVNCGDVAGVPGDIAAEAVAVPRTIMLARLLDRLIAVLDEFNQNGFAALQKRWMKR